MGNTARLTAVDRCDQCGAKAWVRVTLFGTEMLFCAHHAHKYQSKLLDEGTEWHDERDILEEQERARTNA